ncbi:MAG: chemotaxis protein CheA [Deltaproteobacteria bacterium]|nr:chemotaxis protein CheA [Deltaproteobacteria bacterium]
MGDHPSQKGLAEFVSEAQETVEALDADLLRLDEARRGAEADPDVLNAVFRAAHSLKGLASMFGVDRMARLAHALEDRLDDVRMGRQPLDAATLDLLLSAPDLLARIVAEEAKQSAPATAEAAAGLAERLRARSEAGAPRGLDPLADLDLAESTLQVLTEYEEHRLRAAVEKGRYLYRVRASFGLTSFDAALEGLKGRLKERGEVICALPSSDPSEPLTITFDLLVASAEPLAQVAAAAGSPAEVEALARRAVRPAAREAAAPPAQALVPPAAALPALPPLPPQPPAPDAALASAGAPPAAGPAGRPEAEPMSLRSLSQAVRVDIRKLDRLMHTVSELGLLRLNVARIAERLQAGDEPARLGLELVRETRGLERRIGELQGGILEVRMVPLEQIFDKLARMVRKLTRDLQKEIDFRVEGGEVELDKLIVEELSDPLMHLIRNSIDHGVERPEERVRAGKPVAGQVRLRARQRGSHVQIEVEDDGAGIDDRRVREVAVERGLLDAGEAAQLSRRDALGLVFTPGFSTARQVTPISGRGVGMDVVKHNVANLSGIIDLQTERGRGTRFVLTLPTTLAIVRALVVQVSGRSYALPLSSVLEILELRPPEIRTIESREVISLRGATLPLVRLDRFFGLPPPPPGPAFVVVTGLAQQRLGVVVDRLEGQQDVVVKPLGSALGSIKGIAGATDLGGRRTVLVADVGAIIEEVMEGDVAEAAG